MSLPSVRERFLARTETTRVRVPFDTDAHASYEMAVKAREAAIETHEKVKDGPRKLADPAPGDLDLSELDAAVEAADRELDRHSVVVVLRWRPDVYPEATAWARREDRSVYEMHQRIAEGLYVGAEVMDESGAWVDADLSWEDFASHATDGEKHVVGNAAYQLCTMGDAAPFTRRSRGSATT